MTRSLTPLTVGNINLLLLAGLLDTADDQHQSKGEPQYEQRTWSHPCGTPACAIGHWQAFNGRTTNPHDHDLKRCAEEFGLEFCGDDWAYLFGFQGKYPKTAKESADRIREFASRRSALSESGNE